MCGKKNKLLIDSCNLYWGGGSCRYLDSLNRSKRLPFVTIATDSQVFEQFGSITHVGVDDRYIGSYIGNRVLRESSGVENATIVCIDHLHGADSSVSIQCNSATEQIELDGGIAFTILVDASHPSSARSELNNKLVAIEANATITAFITLGELGARLLSM